MVSKSLTQLVDEIISKLSGHLSDDEVRNGWSEISQSAMLTFFRDLKTKLCKGEQLPYLGIVRGLDHWGVQGGEIFSLAAQLDHKLRQP